MGEEGLFIFEGYSFPHLLQEQSNAVTTSNGNYENIMTLFLHTKYTRGSDERLFG